MSSIHRADDGARSLRRPEPRPVRRTPTEAMRTAPYHLGAVMWTNPWETTDDGALFRWVVARSDVLRGSTEFIEDSGRTTAPEARIMATISGLLGGDPSLSWIGLPASRLALFRQLEAARLQATCGGEHNFGLERAVILMNRRAAEAGRRAKPAPALPQPVRQTTPDRRSPRVCVGEPVTLDAAPGSEASLIACDGTLDQAAGLGAYAAVSSDGWIRYAPGRFASAGDAELYAIVAGLELGVRSRSKSFALVSDSLEAIDRLEQILRGSSKRGEAVLRDRIRSVRGLLPSDVTVHHLRRGTGEPLHDAADAIAFAVRRAAMLPEAAQARHLETVMDEWTAVLRSLPGAEVPRRSMKRLVVSRSPADRLQADMSACV